MLVTCGMCCGRSRELRDEYDRSEAERSQQPASSRHITEPPVGPGQAGRAGTERDGKVADFPEFFGDGRRHLRRSERAPPTASSAGLVSEVSQGERQRCHLPISAGSAARAARG
jgi:hypothetical protein